MRIAPLFLALAACGSSAEPQDTDASGTTSPDDAGNTSPDETPTTGATGTTGDLEDATCTPTDNALRFACSATADGTLVWTLSDGSDVLRTLTSEGPSHEVTLYGMAAESDYAWEATGDAGTSAGSIHTGPLPSELADFSTQVEGSTTEVGEVLFPYSCGAAFLMVVDTGGQVVWYQQASETGGGGPSGGISGFAATDRGSFVTAIEGSRVVEWGMDGSKILDVTGFDDRLHHDLDYADGLIYTLNEREVDGLMVDGFDVVDASGTILASWNIADHMEITGEGGGGGPGGGGPGGGGAAQWSHGNSIHVEDGRALLSLRWQSAVVEVLADPSDPDFGDITWILTGEPSDVESDFRWTDGGGFVGQHHARWTADGLLSVFDNGDMSDDSRAVRIALDHDTMTAEEAWTWSLGTHCDIQGANYDLADGGAMVTCGDGGWGASVGPDGGAADWQLSLSCAADAGGGGRGGAMAPRLLPLGAW